jgi:hypothetical protein
MSQKTITLIIVLFAVIVAGMFVYAFLKQGEVESQVENTVETGEEATVVPYPEITRVDAKHYIDGENHTLVGEINFPTPCDLLEVEVQPPAASAGESVNIAFSVINNADTCLSVVTAQRFKVDVVAEENPVFTATFMGRSIDLNLIPAAEGESPDNFELFIKG